ncbi:MAG: reverse transcriptase domain-containing protein [Steroidobacteraceae bacterium]
MGWPLTEKDLKRYPHFDRPLPLSELIRVASSPEEVAKNSFWPFLHYEKSWIRFREPGKSRAELRKSRPIRYAARKDSAIYSRYRALLSDRYEALLADKGLSDCVLAYRRLAKSGQGGGKTNVDFAFDAFQKIQTIGACCAVALDIKGYFDNMDHDLLRAQWSRVMGMDRLPADHFRVFQSVTRYASVDRDALFARMGYLAIKPGRNGGQYKSWVIRRQDVPVQICDPEMFRSLAGKDAAGAALIQVNRAGYGIPQGAPISDVLANIYLLDFDEEMLAFVKGAGGHYMRYSDDILILVPGGEKEGRAAAEFAAKAIRKYGEQIRIKEEKSEIIEFGVDPAGSLRARNVTKPGGKDGLEYLGFRFDGRNAYLRDATLSGVLRKMTMAVRREARQVVALHPGRDQAFLEDQLLRRGIRQRFRQVRDFDEKLSKRRWTFHTYVRRAAKVFGRQGQNFHRQTRSQIRVLRRLISQEIARAMRREAIAS